MSLYLTPWLPADSPRTAFYGVVPLRKSCCEQRRELAKMVRRPNSRCELTSATAVGGGGARTSQCRMVRGVGSEGEGHGVDINHETSVNLLGSRGGKERGGRGVGRG